MQGCEVETRTGISCCKDGWVLMNACEVKSHKMERRKADNQFLLIFPPLLCPHQGISVSIQAQQNAPKNNILHLLSVFVCRGSSFPVSWVELRLAVASNVARHDCSSATEPLSLQC